MASQVECVHCPPATFFPEGLKSHNASKHSTFKVGCHCGNAFTNDNALAQHVSEKHSKRQRHKLVGNHKLNKKGNKKN
ncbi:hypothetical protein RHGRI_030432 [Rhododendron griersonianum]|uniref:C2H2-type domain-containing protein n=1 Tax=Rhododendron griersonianum TaxID=479676 RepID=A0AAV6IRG5_9ERIC|nr:hypothetical protein RHGRI_030432 [Rhododendron griersonianum]